jgi:predicted rRNA methylase YqxC with S4 and FtsJ domains
MSERLDAEEAHDIMRPCFELMREAVHRYGGTVSQFLEALVVVEAVAKSLGEHRWQIRCGCRPLSWHSAREPKPDG